MRALLLAWVGAVLRPARTRWRDRTTNGLLTCLECDVGRDLFVTGDELEGALVAAGIRLGEDGSIYARPRRVTRRRGAWPWGMHLADADERLAFAALVRAVTAAEVPHA